jgi:hypothetical protein
MISTPAGEFPKEARFHPSLQNVDFSLVLLTGQVVA